MGTGECHDAWRDTHSVGSETLQKAGGTDFSATRVNACNGYAYFLFGNVELSSLSRSYRIR